MAVDDIYQVTFHQRVHNVPIANVFHYKQTGASSADTFALGQAFGEKVAVAAFGANLGPEWEAVCLETRLFAPTQGQIVYTSLAGVVGQQVGESMLANQVATLSWYTTTQNKNGRGRTFVSGIIEEQEGRNNLTFDGLSGLQDIGEKMIAQLVATAPDGTWQLQVWSQTNTAAYDVIAYEARSPLKKLRTRTPRIC